jgi:hypothetical protein
MDRTDKMGRMGRIDKILASNYAVHIASLIARHKVVDIKVDKQRCSVISAT